VLGEFVVKLSHLLDPLSDHPFEVLVNASPGSGEFFFEGAFGGTVVDEPSLNLSPGLAVVVLGVLLSVLLGVLLSLLSFLSLLGLLSFLDFLGLLCFLSFLGTGSKDLSEAGGYEGSGTVGAGGGSGGSGTVGAGRSGGAGGSGGSSGHRIHAFMGNGSLHDIFLVCLAFFTQLRSRLEVINRAFTTQFQVVFSNCDTCTTASSLSSICHFIDVIVALSVGPEGFARHLANEVLRIAFPAS
jgi:hypothetical protein